MVDGFKSCTCSVFIRRVGYLTKTISEYINISAAQNLILKGVKIGLSVSDTETTQAHGSSVPGFDIDKLMSR